MKLVSYGDITLAGATSRGVSAKTRPIGRDNFFSETSRDYNYYLKKSDFWFKNILRVLKITVTVLRHDVPEQGNAVQSRR
jgi:hypothetical protein